MPSLTQLLDIHRRILILDAASTQVQVGLLAAGNVARWHKGGEEAGTALFDGVAATLAAAGAGIDGVDAFVFCEGPGSMLGVRTVAMAVRTWQALRPRPAYAYQSLAVAGAYAWHDDPRALTIIADARRDTWHAQPVATDGRLGPLQRVAAPALPGGTRLTPKGFRVWAPLPAGVTPCVYDLSLILPMVADRELFHATVTPDAFQHEAPEYKKWSAQVHSAANSTR